jgi:hypothetical protein
MQDVVVIPTFDRPEMLWLCLDYLSFCPDSRELCFRIYVDAHVGQVTPREEIEEVLAKFPHLMVEVFYREPHLYQGNSYNVLMAYKDVFIQTMAQYVFMVEDDVLIHREFFSWHRLMHSGRKIGCSIAVENPGHGAYASLGVCFRREVLQMVLPHCHAAYFTNMRVYCKDKFPPSRFDCEQDGLFARMLKGERVVWAPTPYAQHVGWYGYHRRKSIRPFGSLEERYGQVKHALSNGNTLRKWVRDFGDIQPLRSCN